MPSARSASNAHTPTQDPCRAHVLQPHSPAHCSALHTYPIPHTTRWSPFQIRYSIPILHLFTIPTWCQHQRYSQDRAAFRPYPRRHRLLPSFNTQACRWPSSTESNISGPKCTIAKAKYLQRRASNRVAVQKSRHKKRQRVRELETEKAVSKLNYL